MTLLNHNNKSNTMVAYCLLSSALSVLLVSLLIRVAPRLGLVDKPDGIRKTHASATPVSGGVAIFAAAALTISIVALISSDFRAAVLGSWRTSLGVSVAALIVVAMGAWDDRCHIPGKIKLLVQILAAALVVYSGVLFRQITLFNVTLPLGWLATPFVVFWLVGCINAINLLDGLDGMASTIGIILLATIGVGAILTGDAVVATIAFIFASSLLGFFVFNLPPAKIFLGDSGSMLIGLVGGSLAVAASYKSSGTLILSAPLALMCLPILDSAAALLRRKLTGRSVYQADRNHLHHRLMLKVKNNRLVLVVVAGLSILTSVAALVTISVNQDAVALIAMILVVGTLIVTDTIGRSELRMLVGRFLKPETTVATGRSTAFRIQGSGDWDALWEDLVDTATRMNIHAVSMDISIPSLHEEYVAQWRSEQTCQENQLWRIKIPLIINSQPYGRMSIELDQRKERSTDPFEDLFELVAMTKKYIFDEVHDLHDVELAPRELLAETRQGDRAPRRARAQNNNSIAR